MALYEKLDVVWFYVSDWARAKKFYEEALGLTPTFGMDQMGWQQAAVAPGSPALGIARAETAGQTPGAGGGAIAVLAVKDIEAARKRLVANRVRCDAVSEIPNIVRLCMFY